jgi:hypothetical protein
MEDLKSLELPYRLLVSLEWFRERLSLVLLQSRCRDVFKAPFPKRTDWRHSLLTPTRILRSRPQSSCSILN